VETEVRDKVNDEAKMRILPSEVFIVSLVVIWILSWITLGSAIATCDDTETLLFMRRDVERADKAAVAELGKAVDRLHVQILINQLFSFGLLPIGITLEVIYRCRYPRKHLHKPGEL
jgi:hypothetical protein